jgi:hypothetical protein
VRLSRPVPPEAFAQHWTRPSATCRLTLEQRKQLLCLTAASSVVPTLEVAVRAAGLPLTQEVLHAAAKAGHLSACEWLRQQGLEWDEEVLAAAAKGGQLELCRALRAGGCPSAAAVLVAAVEGGNAQLVEWLVGEGCQGYVNAARKAAHEGHVGIMDALMQLHEADPAKYPLRDRMNLLQGAAWACGLADFVRVHDWCRARRPAQGTERGYVLLAAVLSPTPDWASKAAWLLDAQGYPPVVEDTMIAASAMARPDAAQRLAWMRARGLRLGAWPSSNSLRLRPCMGAMRRPCASCWTLE